MGGRRPPRDAGEGLLRPLPRPKGVLAIDDMIAALVNLDVNGLCLQWRNHLGGTPPAHLPRWLLMKILAHRIQTTAFGGLDKETRRVVRQPEGRRLASPDLHPFEARIPTTREGTELKTGALLDRLTRSLADFAKLVELFDAHQVSFVSVTQAFNTTTSMGRLTAARLT
jgi:Protein of unknown function (DUF2924)/Resolvase, N terminal domain